jgi:hypothetical protein
VRVGCRLSTVPCKMAMCQAWRVYRLIVAHHDHVVVGVRLGMGALSLGYIFDISPYFDISPTYLDVSIQCCCLGGAGCTVMQPNQFAIAWATKLITGPVDSDCESPSDVGLRKLWAWPIN